MAKAGEWRRREQLESAAESRQREFKKTADECADLSEVEIITLPEGKVNGLGTQRQKFDFNKCMEARGHLLTPSR